MIDAVDHVDRGSRVARDRGPVDDPVEATTVTHAPRSWRFLGPWRERGETWDGRRLVDQVPVRPDLIWERYSVFTDAGARLADRLATLKKDRPKFPTLPVMQDLPGDKHR